MYAVGYADAGKRYDRYDAVCDAMRSNIPALSVFPEVPVAGLHLFHHHSRHFDCLLS